MQYFRHVIDSCAEVYIIQKVFLNLELLLFLNDCRCCLYIFFKTSARSGLCTFFCRILDKLIGKSHLYKICSFPLFQFFGLSRTWSVLFVLYDVFLNSFVITLFHLFVYFYIQLSRFILYIDHLVFGKDCTRMTNRPL